MAGGMNNERNQEIGLRRLAAAAEEAQAGDATEDPWPAILQNVANDSARWALALTHAHEVTGVTPERITRLAPEEMIQFAAEVRAWLVDHPATRTVRPWQ
jgi:hypothetical protein